MKALAHHNNAMLRGFLDRFGFDYEFGSASDYYAEGRFDAALRRVLECYDEITRRRAADLGPERRETYSPILPIHPETGVVEQVRIDRVDAAAATVFWTDGQGEKFETSVLGGAAKCQWKADWAMRWFALGVDYEMSGKDLIDSVKLSSQLCRVLGAQAADRLHLRAVPRRARPEDQQEQGQRPLCRGMAALRPTRKPQPVHVQPAAPREKTVLRRHPPRHGRIHRQCGAGASVEAESEEGSAALMANPAWHAHLGHIPEGAGSPISFGMLLNLASVINAETADMLWGFIGRYHAARDTEDGAVPGPPGRPRRALLPGFRQAAQERFRAPDATERAALADLGETLRALDPATPAEAIQDEVYAVGKRHPFPNLKAWFGCLYQVLLGQDEGPRFGGFVALYGVAETVALIDRQLAPARADA